MTDEERFETLKRLKARLECDLRQVKGIAKICNPPYMCEECDLCYAQGTLGERNIDLARAIKALEKETIPIEWIKDYADYYVADDLLAFEEVRMIEKAFANMLEDWEKVHETD